MVQYLYAIQKGNTKMNKAILLSIRPEWLVKILNGEKTIEVRKLFPKDYVGWVYIYCCKMKDKKHGTDQVLCDFKADKEDKYFVGGNWGNHDPNDIEMPNHNGKVVARFWCDKVEEINYYNNGEICHPDFGYQTDSLYDWELYEKSCLDFNALYKYLGYDVFNETKGLAIHISKLEIFDEPKELSEFKRYIETKINKTTGVPCYLFPETLTKAPQNYCYIDDFFFDDEETKEPESVLIDEKETDGYCS